jgi:hypothetical protein
MAPFFHVSTTKLFVTAADARRLGCQTRWAWLHGRRFQCGKERDPVGRSVLEAASMKKQDASSFFLIQQNQSTGGHFSLGDIVIPFDPPMEKKILKYKIILQIFLENNRRKRKKKQKFDDVFF